MRRLALAVLGLGISSETVAVAGMVLGILAGFSFMGTRESLNPALFWSLGLLFCLLRITCVRIDSLLQSQNPRQSVEEVYFHELPERVSDAVTLIGFGFAAQSSAWLGLATALAAIFSAYVRSLGMMRGAARKSAASGPMTRIHRLIIVSVSSVIMIFPAAQARFSTPVPQIALWVILVGCIATILIRWFNIRRHRSG